MEEASYRVAIARMWGHQFLLTQDDRSNGHLIENLLESHPDDNLVLLAVRFEEMSTETQESLQLIAKEGRNEQIRSRAARLVRPYKHWDEATYQRWLSTQTNLNPQVLSGKL
jgi:hypothetical protein